MRVARVQAQAKVNLTLQVHPGVDAAGYHRLTTLFMRVGLLDVVTVRLGGTSRSLDVTGAQLPAGGLGPVEKNLAYRAAVEYLRHAPAMPQGFAIEIVKRIPVGGGMGGGSADAAGVLRILDTLAPKRMDRATYMRIASSLGADVPFLASDYIMSVGTGRGDILSGPIAPPELSEMLLLIPAFSIATADAYRWLDEDRASGVAAYVERAVTAGADTWAAMETFNDFEPVVERRHPVLREMRERLTAVGARIARLAGSGSCVFGIFDEIPPPPRDLGFDAEEMIVGTGDRVVQVEVQE